MTWLRVFWTCTKGHWDVQSKAIRRIMLPIETFNELESIMGSPTDRRYAESHEWHLLADGKVTLGISRFAVDELTDITFVDLPKVGASVRAGESIGEIESVKATSDLYTGVSGKVIEVNSKVVENPGLLNEDPFGEGWLVRIEAADSAELDSLMDSGAYDKQYPMD